MYGNILKHHSVTNVKYFSSKQNYLLPSKIAEFDQSIPKKSFSRAYV